MIYKTESMNNLDVVSNNDQTIFAIGKEGQAGTYLLRIRLSKQKTISFGRFNGGQMIELDRGDFIYIGSALAQKRATTLGNRIHRHCRRTKPQPPHKIHSAFQQFSNQIGIKYTDNPSDKTLFWNIDHLTNLIEAEIIGIIFTRSPISLENTWSEFIQARDDTSVFAKGLGANDSEGHTHLQATTMSDRAWKDLPADLPRTKVKIDNWR